MNNGGKEFNTFSDDNHSLAVVNPSMKKRPCLCVPDLQLQDTLLNLPPNANKYAYFRRHFRL
jgi:hypothetical protein